MTNAASHSFLNRLAYAMLWAFVFTLPLAGVTEIPGAALITKVTAILAMASGCLAVITDREIRMPGAIFGVLAAFAVCGSAGFFRSLAPAAALEQSMVHFQPFILALLAWQFCREEKRVVQLLEALVLGSMLPSLLTIKAFLPGQTALLQRAAAPDFNPSQFAFLLAFSLPISIYLALRQKGVRLMLYGTNVAISLSAILLTGSIAVIGAALAGVLIAFFSMAPLPLYRRVGAAILLFVLCCVIGACLPPGFLDHAIAPITVAMSFSNLAQSGIPGFCCFIALLGLSLFTAERMYGATRSLWFAILTVWLLGACTLSWTSSEPVWLLFALLAAHSASAKKPAVTEAGRDAQRRVYVEAGSGAW